MTFLESVNFILSDRFGEGKRSDAKRWYNFAYGRIWGLEPWSFKLASQEIAVSANASSVSLGNFVRVFDIRDASSEYTSYPELDKFRPEEIYRHFSESGGYPRGVSVINNTIYLDRPASSARTLRVVGELKFTELVNDGDLPLLPSEFHIAPCHGAISQGLRLENDQTWQGAEQDYRASIEDMKKQYLGQQALAVTEAPAWP